MDDETRRYYREHAEQLAESWHAAGEGVSVFFRAAFPRGACVLEIGSGTGRDLAALVREGYAATGVEPIGRLARAGQRHFPEIRGRIRVGELPDALPSVESLGGPFDGVLCSAVIHHVPRERLFRSVFVIRGLLADSGRLLLSLRKEPPDVDTRSHDADGRYDNGVRAGEIQLLFERAGFCTLTRWETADSLGRSDRRWVTLLLQRQGGVAGQPLAQIEGVLSRDRKVATYKLALLRALTDIALTQPHRATWGPDDVVAVPLQAVAERWILYYWPLFQAKRFLPQMQGDWGKKQHGVGFASELERLIRAFRQRGDLTGYAVTARGGNFTPSDRKTMSALISKLKTVIRAGPVKYAGGSLETGRLFSCDRGRIVVAGRLWRELALMAYWVQDALLLRWAQLVQRLSQDEVLVEEVMPALLAQPSPARETQAARDVYAAAAVRNCVWSGRILRGQFDVDHVIPYALWKNNDLWNLVPSHPRVNARKSDKLPGTDLLVRRREPIVQCWRQLHRGLPERFEREAEAFAGRSLRSRLDPLFDLVVESVEATAVQRSAERFNLPT